VDFTEGVYEGTESCWKVLCVCLFASRRQYEEKIRTLPVDICK
jgi:hypothetical protein